MAACPSRSPIWREVYHRGQREIVLAGGDTPALILLKNCSTRLRPLDVTLDPDFLSNRTIYISYAEPGEDEGVVIKGSGHWLMEEAPGQVIPELVAFINR